jgi:hypothetical protein
MAATIRATKLQINTLTENLRLSRLRRRKRSGGFVSDNEIVMSRPERQGSWGASNVYPSSASHRLSAASDKEDTRGTRARGR